MTISEQLKSTKVPFAVTNPQRIPRERYFDRTFYEMEKEKLWPHVWQMACRLEEIPDPGDFIEYEICDQSVLVVRQADETIKAFDNACPHRATQLALGMGRFGGGQIVCPFHGWRWNLDGSSSFVYEVDQVIPGCMDKDEARLQECLVDTWGGCVWINLDRGARPLQEALAPAAGIMDGLGVSNMRVRWWKEAIVNANWKIAQEAFLEAFHVMRTHPQLTMGAGEDWTDITEYTALENGHGKFATGSHMEVMSADTFLDFMRLLWKGQDAMTLEKEVRLFEGLRNKVPPGEDFPFAAIMAYYEYAAGAGIEVPPIENAGSWGGEVSFFPNYIMLPQWANGLAYRSRPYKDDPEWCRFEVWSLETYPSGQEPTDRPTVKRYATDDTEHWGTIPLQDFSNIERQQRGLHSRNFVASRLYPDYEQNISNVHLEIDRYLAR